MLGLAARLVARGHDATVCAPPDLRGFVEGRGVKFRPLGTDIHSLLAEEAYALHRGAVVWALLAKRLFQRILREQFEALPRAAAGADMIIGACGSPGLPSPRPGIPYRPVAYCPALFRSAEFPPPLIPNQTLPRWVNRLAWRGFLGLQDRLLRTELNRQRAALGLGPVMDTYRYLIGERPLLAADAALAPVPDDAPVPVDQSLPAPDAMPFPKARVISEAILLRSIWAKHRMIPPAPRASSSMPSRGQGAAILARGWAGLGDGPSPTPSSAPAPSPTRASSPALRRWFTTAAPAPPPPPLALVCLRS
jgi:vancomycin aglycone glucosyltransferase